MGLYAKEEKNFDFIMKSLLAGGKIFSYFINLNDEYY